MTSANNDELDFDHLKVVSEDEVEEEDEDEDDAEAAASCPTPSSGGGGGWRGRISSFLRRRNKRLGRRLGVLVKVKRAEKLKEEAMFYGGGEVEEVRDDKGKRKRNKAPRTRRDTNKSSIVCLGYRDVNSWR